MHHYREYVLDQAVRLAYRKYTDGPSTSVALMFHEVNKERTDIKSYTISQNDFISKVEMTSNEFEPMSLQEFSSKRDKKIFNGYYLLTFDDGYQGIIKYAYPYLRDKKIPFTVFITTGFVGREGYMTWDDIRFLSREPLCSIGAHTCTHPKLRYEKRAEWEIKESKRILETEIGKSVEYFAYPYGNMYACSFQNIRQVKKAGFRMAFSTIDTSLNKISCSSAFFIPRIRGEIFDIKK